MSSEQSESSVPAQTAAQAERMYICTVCTETYKIYCSGCSAFVCPAYVEEDVAICPKCGSTTCAKDKNKPHEGSCPKDASHEALMKTAKKSGRRQCWACHSMVECNGGCPAMECFCGASFCYKCGEAYLPINPMCTCDRGDFIGIGPDLSIPDLFPEQRWLEDDDFQPFLNDREQEPRDLHAHIEKSTRAQYRANLRRAVMARMDRNRRRLGIVGPTPLAHEQGDNPRDRVQGSRRTPTQSQQSNRASRLARELASSTPPLIPRGPDYAIDAALAHIPLRQIAEASPSRTIDDEIYYKWIETHEDRINEAKNTSRMGAPGANSRRCSERVYTPETLRRRENYDHQTSGSSRTPSTGKAESIFDTRQIRPADSKTDEGVPSITPRGRTVLDFRRARRNGGQWMERNGRNGR